MCMSHDTHMCVEDSHMTMTKRHFDTTSKYTFLCKLFSICEISNWMSDSIFMLEYIHYRITTKDTKTTTNYTTKERETASKRERGY